MLQRVTVSTVGALCLLLVLGSRGAATTQADLTLEELARASDVIVVGRVIAADAFPEGPDGLPGIHTRVELVAEEFLVGSPVSRITFWVHGGQVGNRLRVVDGQARFRTGEHVALFLFRSSRGALFPTGMARGKWNIVDGLPGADTSTVLEALAHGHDGPSTRGRALGLAQFRALVREARSR